MNVVDIILIILIAAVLAGAFYLAFRKNRGGSGCCGDCCNCKDKRASDCDKNK